MTSRSRRKRQITVPSTRTARLLRTYPKTTESRPAANAIANENRGFGPALRSTLARVALTGMTMVTLLATLGSTAMADATYRDRPMRQSTGKNGAKLKWLPYRPSARTVYRAEQEARQVKLTSYQTSGSAEGQYDRGQYDRGTQADPTPSAQPSKPVDVHNWQLPTLETPVATPPKNLQPSNPTRDLPQKSIRDQIERERDDSHYKDYQTPSVEEEMARGLFKDPDDCPAEHDFKPIDELTDKIATIDGAYPKECTLPWKEYEPREWNQTLFTWKASGLCHNPLYFEDVQLERYGHSWGPYIQPVISQAHFFVTVPFLPYKTGLNPPRECIYTLGYYRPGNCAPYMIDPLPLSIRAGLLQAGVVTGATYLYP